MAGVPPPTLPGWPLVGNFFAYRRDHLRVFWRGYRELGPIFALRLGPQRAAVLIGPEYHRFFFTAVDGVLSLPEVYRFVLPMFGPVLNAAPDEHTRRGQLALLHSAFQAGRMERHVEVMAAETSSWLDTLGDAGEFEVYEAFAALGMNIAAAALLGPEVRARMAEFRPLLHDLARGMDFVLPPDLPLPRFRRRDRARRRLAALIRPALARRRADPGQRADLLQAILAAYAAQDGRGDETIVGLALMTVFTGYIATAAQTCWGLIQLLQHPAYLETVLQEQRAVLGGGPGARPALQHLEGLQRLDWALKETQRMYPVMTHQARFTARPYELGGYRVPRGWLTMICPAVAHRLPAVFPNPDAYDPERFSPDRGEDRRQSYSLVGFGGGLYRCPGAGFGTNEMKCVLSLLLRRYELSLAGPAPDQDFTMGVSRPRPPCRVRYRRRAWVGAGGRPEAPERGPVLIPPATCPARFRAELSDVRPTP